MASYTSSLRLVLPATGEYPGAWGTQANNGLTSLVDTSIAGTSTITMTAADYTLSTANGASDEARSAVLNVAGTPGAARNIIVPAASKLYVVFNNTTGGFAQTVKTSAGTGVSVPNGSAAYLRCDGTNVVAAVSYFGSLTLGAALPVGSGGTGAATFTANNVLLGNGTSAFQVVAPGTNGNVLTSNGTTWQSTAPASGVSLSADNTWTGTQTFSGTAAKLATALTNAAEVATVSATAATGTINYDITTQSVLYYTSNASANWTTNFRASSGTSLNTAMSTGQSVTVAFLVTQGATAYYNNVVQVDGSAVTPKWQGGTAPTAGNASSIDVYTYTIVKTGSAAFTVFASQTRFA
jgi:hypothetical protein